MVKDFFNQEFIEKFKIRTGKDISVKEINTHEFGQEQVKLICGEDCTLINDSTFRESSRKIWYEYEDDEFVNENFLILWIEVIKDLFE